MRILFVHQNFPGQYQYLAPNLAKRGHRVLGLSKRPGVQIPGVEIANYTCSGQRAAGTHPLVDRFEKASIMASQLPKLQIASGGRAR